jgi:transcriptional regulator with XRE-family HTH domain
MAKRGLLVRTYQIRYARDQMSPGEIIRARRLANGLTQAQLALRAGTTQAAISRLERGELSPTFETFERLLAAIGEEARIEVRRSPGPCDPTRLHALRSRPASERFALAIGWNRLAGEFARAGERARAADRARAAELAGAGERARQGAP